MIKRLLVVVLVLTLLPVVSISAQDDGPPRFINHRGQDLFLNGINLAWIHFAQDTKNFDEVRFVAALDEIADAHSNTMRWWLHTDGSASPVYGEDGMVTGLAENDIKNMKRALDLAYERGVLIMMTLWSHDMLKEKEGVPAEWNKLMIEDPAYTQAYIDNALIPLVEALKGHPGIIAWEITNEPEGITEEFGWTEYRTDMASIQQFTNLLAGAIHRTDPEAKVTNGTWSFRALTDVGGYYNYYTDERLIEAGGDPDGTLDFYQVHFYPEHFGDDLSPFHNPASHWELDKPVIVGEFPAAGIRDLGMGYKPEGRIMRHSIDAYTNLYENGYAGALSWMWGGGDHGSMLDAAAGIITVHNLDPEHVDLDIGDVDHIPAIEMAIENVVVTNDLAEYEVANLGDVFEDQEDGDALTFEVTGNTGADLMTPVITDDGALVLEFVVGEIGSGSIEITATDSAGNQSWVSFIVQVTDPNMGNVALGKPIVSSTLESTAYAAEYAVDGDEDSRWSTEYADDQYLTLDLEGVFNINQIVIDWETAYGKHYEIQVWDGEAWQTVFTETTSDGGLDDIAFDEPVVTRYLRLHGVERGTQWGFSIWELQVNGVRAEGDFPELEVPPAMEEVAAAEEEEEGPPIGETTHIFSFEAGATGWAMVDWMSAATGAAHSTEMASEGQGSLMISGNFNGTEWQETGASVVLPKGIDWSQYGLLTADLYVPEGAEGFLAQVFVKTGEDWTWANTPDHALVAGEWNVLTAMLGDMGNVADMRELGVKIGTSTTAFEGDFYLDNVALATLLEMPEEEVEEAPVYGVPKAMLVYTFEKGLDGFVFADYWPAGLELAQSDEMATRGSQSLKMTGTFSGTEWQEMGAYVDPAEPFDWSSWDTVSVDIYAPAEAEGFLAQVFVKTGEEWTWANSADIPLAAGAWTTAEVPLDSLGDMTNVKEVGVKIGTGGTAFEGAFFVDGLRLDGIFPLPAPEPAVLYGFEDGLGGWVFADYWPAGVELVESDEMASEGSLSLKMTGAFSGTEWQEMGAYIDPADGYDWTGYTTVSVDIYAPEGAEGFLAQIFVKTGDDWAWANSADIQLAAGAWTTAEVPLDSLGDVSAGREVGVKIGTSTGAYEGPFYVDNLMVK